MMASNTSAPQLAIKFFIIVSFSSISWILSLITKYLPWAYFPITLGRDHGRGIGTWIFVLNDLVDMSTRTSIMNIQVARDYMLFSDYSVNEIYLKIH